MAPQPFCTSNLVELLFLIGSVFHSTVQYKACCICFRSMMIQCFGSGFRGVLDPDPDSKRFTQKRRLGFVPLGLITIVRQNEDNHISYLRNYKVSILPPPSSRPLPTHMCTITHSTIKLSQPLPACSAAHSGSWSILQTEQGEVG